MLSRVGTKYIIYCMRYNIFMCNTNANYLTVRLRLHGTGRLRNRTKICTVPPVYTELDDFGTGPKFVRFHCLHGTGRLRNRTKICRVPPVYTELDDFGTVPKFVRFHAPVYAVPDDFGTGPKFVRFTCLHGTDELESG